MSHLKFLLDENIPRSLLQYLISMQISADFVPKGIKNSKVAKLAKDLNAILLTRDSDFANTIMYPPKDFYGILCFKFIRHNPHYYYKLFLIFLIMLMNSIKNYL